MSATPRGCFTGGLIITVAVVQEGSEWVEAGADVAARSWEGIATGGRARVSSDVRVGEGAGASVGVGACVGVGSNVACVREHERHNRPATSCAKHRILLRRLPNCVIAPANHECSLSSLLWLLSLLS